VPSLFRRRPADVVEKPGADQPSADELTHEHAPGDDGSVESVGPGEDAEADGPRPRGYTPSKRELGRTTPKRPSAHVRRPGTTPAARSRKQMTKEERRELREARRARRREVSDGMRRGDPRYLPARDQGPEKAIARDVVDSRRTVGTWFFGAALVILLASSTAVPVLVTAANALFLTLTLALSVDAVLLCRKIKWLVRERHPDSTQRMGGLYFYAVVRSLTFRRLRIPLPRKKFGDSV
jgi:hypothetical protein